MVEHQGIPLDVGGLLDIQTVRCRLQVDHWRVGRAVEGQDHEGSVHAGVRTDGQRQYLERERRLGPGAQLDEVPELRTHDIGAADRAADDGFVKYGPDFGRV